VRLRRLQLLCIVLCTAAIITGAGNYFQRWRTDKQFDLLLMFAVFGFGAAAFVLNDKSGEAEKIAWKEQQKS
jgi:hypothetical protein